MTPPGSGRPRASRSRESRTTCRTPKKTCTYPSTCSTAAPALSQPPSAAPPRTRCEPCSPSTASSPSTPRRRSWPASTARKRSTPNSPHASCATRASTVDGRWLRWHTERNDAGVQFDAFAAQKPSPLDTWTLWAGPSINHPAWSIRASACTPATLSPTSPEHSPTEPAPAAPPPVRRCPSSSSPPRSSRNLPCPTRQRSDADQHPASHHPRAFLYAEISALETDAGFTIPSQGQLPNRIEPRRWGTLRGSGLTVLQRTRVRSPQGLAASNLHKLECLPPTILVDLPERGMAIGPIRLEPRPAARPAPAAQRSLQSWAAKEVPEPQLRTARHK